MPFKQEISSITWNMTLFRKGAMNLKILGIFIPKKNPYGSEPNHFYACGQFSLSEKILNGIPETVNKTWT